MRGAGPSHILDTASCIGGSSAQLPVVLRGEMSEVWARITWINIAGTQ